MAIGPDPGGLTYALPLGELRMVAALFRRGADSARQDGITLSPELWQRIDDISTTAKAVRAASASGNGAGPLPANGSKTSGRGRAKNGHSGKMEPMGISEASILSGLTPRRIRQLAGSELPGRRTSAGWVFAAEDVDRWLAGRQGK